MKSEMKQNHAERPGRRAFFGRLFAAVGGGLLAGDLLRKIGGSRAGMSSPERAVTVRTNPLAVPRTKEGSKSNV